MQKMGSKLTPDRLILALTDKQLEEFVLGWLKRKKAVYVDVELLRGTGDRGRDVVGFLTDSKFESDWHNYQCKQLTSRVGTAQGIGELAKVLYYAHLGEFTAPAKYFFVAPKGMNRNLRTLIGKPSKLQKAILDEWDQRCSNSIIDNQHVNLTPDLRKFIENWDFKQIKVLTIDEIIADPHIKPSLKEWFDIDPGPPPDGIVPIEVDASELPYVRQLVDAYNERDSTTLTPDAIHTHVEHGPHLHTQRERFYHADAFMRFYRDNTMQQDIAALRTEVRHGVDDVHRLNHQDTLERVNAVMIQAANVQPTGSLAKHARVQVRQGLCHHFVNDGEMKWPKK